MAPHLSSNAPLAWRRQFNTPCRPVELLPDHPAHSTPLPSTQRPPHNTPGGTPTAGVAQVIDLSILARGVAKAPVLRLVPLPPLVGQHLPALHAALWTGGGASGVVPRQAGCQAGCQGSPPCMSPHQVKRRHASEGSSGSAAGAHQIEVALAASLPQVLGQRLDVHSCRREHGMNTKA